MEYKVVSLRWGMFEKHQIAGISRKSSENFFIFCSQSEKLSVREQKKRPQTFREENHKKKKGRSFDTEFWTWREQKKKREDVEEVSGEWKQASE